MILVVLLLIGHELFFELSLNTLIYGTLQIAVVAKIWCIHNNNLKTMSPHIIYIMYTNFY